MVTWCWGVDFTSLKTENLMILSTLKNSCWAVIKIWFYLFISFLIRGKILQSLGSMLTLASYIQQLKILAQVYRLHLHCGVLVKWIKMRH